MGITITFASLGQQWVSAGTPVHRGYWTEEGAAIQEAGVGLRRARGGGEGHGVLNHRAERLPPVYCRIKRSDCYVMDHLYASTLNSSRLKSI